MNNDGLNNPLNDPNLIAGIYNYCDRWCERCPFTSRCLNYITLNECFNNDESKDVQNKKFWDKLNELFDTTYNFMDEFLSDEENNFLPLDDEESEEALRKQMDDIENKVENNKCKILSEEYSYLLKDWFDLNEKQLNEKENDLKKERTDLPNKNPLLDAFELKDAVDVILYYGFFISAKIYRAIHGLYDELEDELDDMPKDSDGSAKIAMIAIDRSIAAWGEIYYHFSQKEVIEFVLLLDKLKKSIEQFFPNAKKFRRPGFDD